MSELSQSMHKPGAPIRPLFVHFLELFDRTTCQPSEAIVAWRIERCVVVAIRSADCDAQGFDERRSAQGPTSILGKACGRLFRHVPQPEFGEVIREALP